MEEKRYTRREQFDVGEKRTTSVQTELFTGFCCFFKSWALPPRGPLGLMSMFDAVKTCSVDAGAKIVTLNCYWNYQ